MSYTTIERTLFRERAVYRGRPDPWRLRGWVIGVATISGILLLLVTVPLGCVRIDRWTCGNRADALGLEWRHRPFADGCYVAVDGEWVPIDQRRWMTLTGDDQ